MVSLGVGVAVYRGNWAMEAAWIAEILGDGSYLDGGQVRNGGESKRKLGDWTYSTVPR